MTLTLLQLLEPLADPKPVVVEETPIPLVIEMPEEIIDEARAEAARITAEAHRQASAILEDARQQAIAIRETAWQEGRRDGDLAARNDAEERLRKEMDAFRADVRADVQQIVDSIAEGRKRLWEGQQTEMLAFVLDVSRQVIKTEVQQNPEVLMEILRNAMRRVTDKENMRIRVSVSDAQRIKAAREDVMQIVDGIHTLEIVDDRRIGPGGCVIETNAGTIDAKIETQLSEIERAILECE